MENNQYMCRPKNTIKEHRNFCRWFLGSWFDGPQNTLSTKMSQDHQTKAQVGM